MAQRASQTTTNHEQIRKWVEAHGGHPATVKGTPRKGEEAGLLRIDLPGGAGQDRLEPISWNDFFEKFDESKLAFVYDRNKNSTFCKLVSRQSAARKNPRD